MITPELVEEQQQEQNIITLEIVPFGNDQWKSMGTEYEKSFLAFKEITDNSISASGQDKCEILITLIGQDENNMIVSIEDASGGVNNPNTLLRISSDSKSKVGTHNIYGHGLKHSLAYFNPNHNESSWLIQSRTSQMMEDDMILQVRAPYLYNHEDNPRYGHRGMNVQYVNGSEFIGVKSRPGTIIQFTTLRSIFGKMNPLKDRGAPMKDLGKIAEEMSNLFSLYYLPLFRKSLLEIEIKYYEKERSEVVNTIRCQSNHFPILSTISNKHYNDRKVYTSNGKSMQISASWYEINRDNPHPFVYPQRNGVICYVNGIAVDPYIWIPESFGDIANHPSLNSLICVVEVEGDKDCVPELSVSKTKFRINGDNYQSMLNHLVTICPKTDIGGFSKLNNSDSEIAKRDRRYDMLIDTLEKRNITEFIKKEQVCVLPNTNKAGDNMRYDIIYKIKSQPVIYIEEFKKDSVKPQDVAQIIQYGMISKKVYDMDVDLILVGKQITPTAQELVNMYVGEGWNIKFQSFSDLHIP
jgi:hypothetical protein